MELEGNVDILKLNDGGRYSARVTNIWLSGFGVPPVEHKRYVFTYEAKPSGDKVFNNVKHYVEVKESLTELKPADKITDFDTREGQKRIDILRSVALKAAIDTADVMGIQFLEKTQDDVANDMIKLAKRYEEYLKGEE